MDRPKFVAMLDSVRKIRNDVMHFDPDPLSRDDIILLNNFAKGMRTLRRVGAVEAARGR